MNSEDITLRTETYTGLTTKGAGLTATEFDENFIGIFKDFEALANALGVPAYDAETTYDNDYNNSETESFATYNSKLWMWINASSGSNVTPVEGSDWTSIFPTMLAHEKNKDRSFLKTDEGFMIYNTDQEITVGGTDYELPSAKCQVVHNGVIYTAGVEDSSTLSGGFQSILYAFNPSTLESYGVIVSEDGSVHVKNGSVKIQISDSGIFLKTPEQIAGNLSNGNILQVVDASTGEVEFVNPASTGLRIGFVDYNDAATAVTPITVLAATPTVMTNDTLGPFTNTSYLPSGVTSIWDALTNSFDWSELNLGDMVDIRLDLDVITSSVNTIVEVDLILGTGGGSYSIPFIIEKDFKTVATHKVASFNGVYMGDNNTLNNGGQLKITSDKNCTVIVNGWYCKIIKN